MKKSLFIALSLTIQLFCSENSIHLLQQQFPWPLQRPSVKPYNHGWFYNQEQLNKILNNKMELIVELGSWLGSSTLFILEHAPRATVIAIDHWKGSAEHLTSSEFKKLLPILYETFIVNCWRYKGRLIPLQMTTIDGLKTIHSYNLHPDLIYIDASHDYESVLADLECSYELFPESMVTGDDWQWETVRHAVHDFIQKHNLRVEADNNFYIII